MSAAQEATQLTDDELIEKYIYASPRRGGLANVVVEPYVISVWALIGAMTLGGATAEEVVRDYRITDEAMQAALAFYRRHKEVIDARIDENA